MKNVVISVPEDLCQRVVTYTDTTTDTYAVFDGVKREIRRQEASIAFAGLTNQIRDNPQRRVPVLD